MNQIICDDCIRAITFNLTQDEILLLSKMKENTMETPQLSADESRLITLVKSLSPYKIKFVLQRFLLVNLIASVKVGITRYYITDTGKRLLELYMADTVKIKNGGKKK